MQAADETTRIEDPCNHPKNAERIRLIAKGAWRDDPTEVTFCAICGLELRREE